MTDLLIYISICGVGIFVGNHLRKKGKKLKWSSKIQMLMLIILLFTMGTNLSVDDRVMSNLGKIGISSLIITLFALVGSVLAIHFTRKMLKFDHYGNRISTQKVDSKDMEAK